MSTSEFVSKINDGNSPDTVVRFFDEIMILYNLLGSKRDMKIYADGGASVATFTLMMNSDDDAVNIYNTLNNTFFSIYNDKYIIEMSLSGRSVLTSIYKAIS